MEEIAKPKSQGVFHTQITALLERILPRIPSRCETYHLTYMTIGWSILSLFSGYMSVTNSARLFGVATAMLLQGITDILDGAIGRMRNTGLVKRGFYMDHFLDQIFLYAVLFSLYFYFPDHGVRLLLLGIIGSLFFLHTFLMLGAGGGFTLLSGGVISPNEVRYVGVILICVAYVSPLLFEYLFPLGVLGGVVYLGNIVYVGQKSLWDNDMETLGK